MEGRESRKIPQGVNSQCNPLVTLQDLLGLGASGTWAHFKPAGLQQSS